MYLLWNEKREISFLLFLVLITRSCINKTFTNGFTHTQSERERGMRGKLGKRKLLSNLTQHNMVNLVNLVNLSRRRLVLLSAASVT